MNSNCLSIKKKVYIAGDFKERYYASNAFTFDLDQIDRLRIPKKMFGPHGEDKITIGDVEGVLGFKREEDYLAEKKFYFVSDDGCFGVSLNRMSGGNVGVVFSCWKKCSHRSGSYGQFFIVFDQFKLNVIERLCPVSEYDYYLTDEDNLLVFRKRVGFNLLNIRSSAAGALAPMRNNIFERGYVFRELEKKYLMPLFAEYL